MIPFWFSEPHVSFDHVVFETIHLFVVLRFWFFARAHWRYLILSLSSFPYIFSRFMNCFFAFLLNKQRQTVNCRLFFTASLILVQLKKGPRPLGTSLLEGLRVRSGSEFCRIALWDCFGGTIVSFIGYWLSCAGNWVRNEVQFDTTPTQSRAT